MELNFPVPKHARRGEPLSAHTTMRVGGSAAWWVEPQSEDELAAVLQAVASSGRPLQVLGSGSNVVAGDEGFDGVVVKLGTGFDWSRVEGERVTTGGAFFLPRLTHLALDNRLGNLEWACGVPGSVGGSIWGNAGARGFNGQAMESRDAGSDLESLIVYDRRGRRHGLQRSDVEFSYRRSSLGELIVAEATFTLQPLHEKEVQAHREAVKQLLKKRRATQPVNAACAGCIWKNPKLADCRGAGQLIEQLGLKGHRVGGAAISEVHANFIVNIDRATGADARALMCDVEQKVEEAMGVRLEREVRLLGTQ
ncbi:MAG TPA: UDP-N-acetylmuramate dehydrogenase [Abditibacteriaceae bacterium]|nr:UDP-N-acetylmuramate dehydrogenase [Abditibacteriaceae bacterium]